MLRTLALVSLTLTSVLYGDIVYLEDGSKQRGTVSVEKSQIIVITDSGQRIEIPKTDVKRVVYESNATPEELLEMLNEFESLIAPALGLVGPEQREFGQTTRSHASSAQRSAEGFRIREGNKNAHVQRAYQSSSGSRSYGSETVWRDGLYTEEVTTDKFVDNWVKYAAQFRAIQKTQAYKRHTRPRKKEQSLAGYVRNRPRTEEAETIGFALRDMLDTVKKTFKYAQAADGAMNIVRKREVDWDKRIRRADISARRTKVNAKTSKAKQHADIDVDSLRAQKANEIQQRKLTADNTVNLVAGERIIAIEMLRQARSVLNQAIEMAVVEPAPKEQGD